MPGIYNYISETHHVSRVHRVAVILLTYLITPWSRVLLEKLPVFQLVKKLSAFYATQMFITAFTSA
jgi:hypothetical protein